jgi:hypothetical protein
VIKAEITGDVVVPECQQELRLLNVHLGDTIEQILTSIWINVMDFPFALGPIDAEACLAVMGRLFDYRHLDQITYRERGLLFPGIVISAIRWHCHAPSAEETGDKDMEERRLSTPLFRFYKSELSIDREGPPCFHLDFAGHVVEIDRCLLPYDTTDQPLFNALGMEMLERTGFLSETAQRSIRGAILRALSQNFAEALSDAGCVHAFILNHRHELPPDIRLISAIARSSSPLVVRWVIGTLTMHDASVPPWPLEAPIIYLPREVTKAWQVIRLLGRDSPSWSYALKGIDREFTEAFLREILKVLAGDAKRLVGGMLMTDTHLTLLG